MQAVCISVSSFVLQMEEMVSDVVSADVSLRVEDCIRFSYFFVLIFESSGSQVGHDPKSFFKMVCGKQGDLKNANRGGQGTT